MEYLFLFGEEETPKPLKLRKPNRKFRWETADTMEEISRHASVSQAIRNTPTAPDGDYDIVERSGRNASVVKSIRIRNGVYFLLNNANGAEEIEVTVDREHGWFIHVANS